MLCVAACCLLLLLLLPLVACVPCFVDVSIEGELVEGHELIVHTTYEGGTEGHSRCVWYCEDDEVCMWHVACGVSDTFSRCVSLVLVFCVLFITCAF